MLLLDEHERRALAAHQTTSILKAFGVDVTIVDPAEGRASLDRWLNTETPAGDPNRQVLMEALGLRRAR